jgi:hypothetical protein
MSDVHGPWFQVRGEKHPRWKGGRNIRPDGYVRIFTPDHPRAVNGYVMEHILLAEKALGKPLPFKAVVHHHDPEQLVICEDRAYHNFLHKRQRAYEACGHAGWLKCHFCKQYDDPAMLYVSSRDGRAFHRHCRQENEKKKKKEKKLKED